MDAVNTYSTTGSNKTTSATISHTVSGNNRLLLVGVNMWPGGSGNYATSVTYGGVSLAKITDVSRSTSIRTELWKLVAPATGTANVVVNITGSPNQNTFLAVGTISFTGVDQSTPYRTPATTGTGNGTSASVTVSSATGEMVLSVAGAGTSSYNFTSITGGTERWNLSAATSTKAAAGTAPGDTSVTLSHGLSSANDWAIIGLAIKPASLTGATWAATKTQLSGLTKNTTKRLRFLVSNTGSGNSSGATYQLQAAQAATCSRVLMPPCRRTRAGPGRSPTRPIMPMVPPARTWRRA